jgi:mono/diheme cytochrome c family protein
MLYAMRVSLFVAGLSLSMLNGAVGVCGAQNDAHAVERGSYLVNQMGKCGDCHTPRAEHGLPDKQRWLKGSPLGFKPLGPVPGFATAAPDITGTSDLWKSWGEKGMVQFFLTGKTPDGKLAAPPMPAYTLKSEDAHAIVAYLKSLP